MPLVVPLLICLLASACQVAGQTPPGPACPEPPEGVTLLADVAYLEPGREEKMDIYLPANRVEGARSPAMVIIHGGGWAGGDKAARREYEIGTTLARAGYVAASINYQMTAGKRWPANLHDCKNAVRFLRAYAPKFGVDPERIGVMGGSAGGHLALMVAYTTGISWLEPARPYPGVSSAVSCVIDMYGITNLLTRRRTDAAGNPTAALVTSAGLFPQTREQDPERWRLASPVLYVTRSSPPTLILHGLADTTVDHGQATDLAARLRAKGVDHRLVLLKGVGHTFYFRTWRNRPLPVDLEPVVLEFLDRHLK